MTDSQVKRDVVIQLKLEAAKDSKAGADKIKKALKEVEEAAKSGSNRLEKHYSNAWKKMEAASKKYGATVSRVHTNLNKTAESAFKKIDKIHQSSMSKTEAASKKAAATYSQSWKKAIDDVRDRLNKGGMPGQSLASQMPIPSTANVQVQAADESSKAWEKSTHERLSHEKFAASEATAAWDRYHNAQKEMRGSFDRAATSAVMFGKGLATAGLAGEENTQKILKGLVQIEAGFNIIRGGVGTWVALKDAIDASRKAAAAYAITQGTIGFGSVAGGIAGGVAGRAAAPQRPGFFRRASDALGEGVGLGLGYMGITKGKALWGGARSTGQAMSSFVNDPMRILQGLGPKSGPPLLSRTAGAIPKSGIAGLLALGGVETFQLLARTAGYDNEWTKSRTGQLGGAIGRSIGNWWVPEKDTSGQLELLKARRRMREQQDELENAAIGRRAGVREDLHRMSEARHQTMGILRGESPHQVADAARKRALAEVSRAEQELAAAKERNEKRAKNHQSTLHQDTIQAHRFQVRAVEELSAAEEQRLKVMRQLVDTRKMELAATEQARDAAKSALETEQDRTESKLADFGRLSPGEQNRAKDVTRRYEAGEKLTQAEIDFLEQIKLGQPLVQNHYARKGREAGGLDVLTGLGERDMEAEAHNDLMRIEASIWAKSSAYAQSLESSTQSQKQALEVNEELYKAKKRLADAINKEAEESERRQGVNVGATGAGDVAAFELFIENAIGRVERTITRAVNQVENNVQQYQMKVAAMGNVV